MPTSDRTNLSAQELARWRRSLAQVQEIGLFRRGTLLSVTNVCGKPTCRCHAQPPQPHGPYWQWTRKVQGKTVTARLSDEQAALLRVWLDNARRLDDLIAELDQISTQVTDRTLASSSSSRTSASTSLPSSASPTAFRMTRQLAEALTHVSELMSPVADAAQQWLEAKDDDDRELLTEAKVELDATLAESSDLLPTMARILRLAHAVPTPTRLSRPLRNK
jgi:hypothetical protein